MNQPGAGRMSLDVAHRGFLVELAIGGLLRILVAVEAALRHLPPVALALALGLDVVATADPDAAVAVEQRDADAGPVGQVFDAFGLAAHERPAVTSELKGTRVTPRSAADWANAATRSMVAGKAVPVAMA